METGVKSLRVADDRQVRTIAAIQIAYGYGEAPDGSQISGRLEGSIPIAQEHPDGPMGQCKHSSSRGYRGIRKTHESP